MLNHIVAGSIRNRGVVIALACLILAYGIYVAARTKLDVFPDFAPPMIIVQTEAPGLSPEQVEQLVTRPIEVSINGVAGLDTLRSHSIQGLSVITATFHEGVDIYRARQLTSERLTEAARSLPQTVKAPVMSPLTSATSLVLVVGLTSGAKSPADLRTIADFDVKPRLLGVPGVANVVIFGGDVKQLQAQLIPEKLKKYGISFQEALDGLGNATGLKGAGFVETRNQRTILRTEGQRLTPETLSEAVVRRSQGISLRLKDIANVVNGAEPKFGDSQIMGTPGIVMMISGQYGTNTLEVTQAVERELKSIEPVLKSQGIEMSPQLFRPANFIQTAVSNVQHSLLQGALLVIVVLFLFLWNARISFISLTAIPLSLILAVLVLNLAGISLNTLTLGGLAIAIGEVVDAAIIDVENIYRRLKENAKSAAPLPKHQVVFNASIEVRSAVVYATFIVILVFFPVVTMSGIQGKLFAPLGYAYILSILASLVVALTLTPALSDVLLRHDARFREEPQWIQKLKSYYESHLGAVLVRPTKTVAIALSLLIASLGLIPLFGGAFLPEFKEGHFIIHMSAAPGTSLEESMDLGKRLTAELLKLPEVRSVAQRAGRAELGDDTWGVHYSEFEVDLKQLSGEEGEAAEGKIREALSRFPGVYFAIKPFLTERIEETLSGSTAQVVIKLFGDDLSVLDQKAQEILTRVSKIQGATDVQLGSQATTPELGIALKEAALVQYGFQPVAVLNAIQAAYQGATVSQVFEGNRVFDVVAILDEKARTSPAQIGSLLLRNPEGAWVSLKDLADIRLGSGRYIVFHEGGRRLQLITCNVAGRDLAAFTAEVSQQIRDEVKLPPGTYFSIGGAAEANAKARKELWVNSALAAVGIFLLLWTAFNKLENVLLVLMNLPFALVGGLLAVFGTGGWLSLGSLVGFVSLFGISTRNSIMLISHYEHLVEKEGEAWGPRCAIRGAKERLLPILMTASVAALGLLPIAIGSGDPGREIEGPMAIVILGGLLSSTVLNLLLLPTLALKFGSFGRKSKENISLEA